MSTFHLLVAGDSEGVKEMEALSAIYPCGFVNYSWGSAYLSGSSKSQTVPANVPGRRRAAQHWSLICLAEPEYRQVKHWDIVYTYFVTSAQTIKRLKSSRANTDDYCLITKETVTQVTTVLNKFMYSALKTSRTGELIWMAVLRLARLRTWSS